MNTEDSEKDKTKIVGYCNPPAHARFQKGRSGNVGGRPRGTLNIRTVLERALREEVFIEENGKRKSVTKLEAAVKHLVDKSAAGDLKAFQQLAALIRSTEEGQIQDPTPYTVEVSFDRPPVPRDVANSLSNIDVQTKAPEGPG
jgi:hypothetical protein